MGGLYAVVGGLYACKYRINNQYPSVRLLFKWRIAPLICDNSRHSREGRLIWLRLKTHKIRSCGAVLRQILFEFKRLDRRPLLGWFVHPSLSSADGETARQHHLIRVCLPKSPKMGNRFCTNRENICCVGRESNPDQLLGRQLC